MIRRYIINSSNLMKGLVTVIGRQSLRDGTILISFNLFKYICLHYQILLESEFVSYSKKLRNSAKFVFIYYITIIITYEYCLHLLFTIARLGVVLQWNRIHSLKR